MSFGFVENRGVLGEDSKADTRPQGPVFATTHWSVVLKAAQRSTPGSDRALEKLCHTYWFPLYSYVRRWGASPDDAKDLTQAFFAHLLRRDFLNGVAPEKGRFRSFLLTALKHFLADEWAKANASKRQPSDPQSWLDLQEAERRYQLEACVTNTPENLYDRRWALDLLDHVLDELRAEAVAGGKEDLFDRLQCCLLGGDFNGTYAELGARLGMTPVAVKVSVHRLRQRFRELLRQEIAHTVARPEDIAEEMHFLFKVVSC